MPVLVAVRDLLFRSRISAAAQRLGVDARLAPRGVPLADAVRDAGAATVLVDLGEPGVLDEIRRVRATGNARVVGFLGHLETALAQAALDAGVDEVLSRGQLAARLDDVLRSATGSAASR